MTFYMCVIILTELLMLAMTLHVVNYTGFTKTQKTWFILTFAAVMLCAGAEFAVHCGYYDPRSKILLTVLTTAQFSVAPLLAILFTGALGMKQQVRFAVVFFVLNALVETAFAPFGLIFYFDSEGYHRGPLFLIYTAFYFISLIYLIVGMILVGRKFRHRDAWTIVMLLVILAAGIFPMTFFKINVTYIAVGIAASLCYIYYNDIVQQDIHAELVSSQEKMSRMQGHMISGLANLIENRDMETGEHITRTGDYVNKLAEFAAADGVYADVIDIRFIGMMRTLSPLHDIGKIIVSDSILKKPGRLTAEEFELMKKHAAAGGDMVREILGGISDEEYLSFAADIAKYHHEWWNGQGYPEGLKGDEIPLSARIMAIADVYDALISERCYKKPMSPDEAFAIIEKESGTHFDPALVEVLLRHKEEFR